MNLDNKLGITNQAHLAHLEEKISKQKAKQLFDSGDINKIEVGTFKGLASIHLYLFEDIYNLRQFQIRFCKKFLDNSFFSDEVDKDIHEELKNELTTKFAAKDRICDSLNFAGTLRDVNISKGNFRFASVLYLSNALEKIDLMPKNNFEQIIEKYVEMNIAHPFREGNGRATRIWLDLILKQELELVIDWNLVDKDYYLLAMQRSVINDLEIKTLLKNALTNQIDSRTLFMKNIDISYYYEGYNEFKTEEI